MSRLLFKLALIAVLAAVWPGNPGAQGFSALARVDGAQSGARDTEGGVTLELALSLGVPHRVFTLTSPPRIVLDFQEVDWTGLDPEALEQSAWITRARFGAYVPGWSRLVAELAGPMAVLGAEMQVDTASRAGKLTVWLRETTPERFAAAAGAPHDPRWDLPEPAQIPARPKGQGGELMVVVIDPGHGGIDPGAEAGATDEKTLMLTFARELRELLLRTGGFEVVLTREGDHFVSLERRIAVAHRVSADVFLSLHADALSEGKAHGATVHVLSKEASDVASAKLAERHDRAELIAGVDLSEADDEVTGILLDLARQETRPRTLALAQALVRGMADAGGPMNRRPLRAAGFSVLKAADIPSVLVEIGFMSSARDMKNIQNPEWRARMAIGIRNALVDWRESDLARRPLVRQ